MSQQVFRPSEFVNSFALVLKPREILKRSSEGKSEVLCSAIVFDTEDSLDEGRPTRVIVDTVVSNGGIYRPLVAAYRTSSTVVGYVGKGEPTSHGTKPWLIKELDEDTARRVVEVWEQVTA